MVNILIYVIMTILIMRSVSVFSTEVGGQYIIFSSQMHWLVKWMRRQRTVYLVFLLVVLTVTGACVLLKYRAQLIIPLETFTDFIREMGIWGMAMCASVIFVLSFPPIVGYSFFITLCGHIFGILSGFAVVFVGAMTGAVCCFEIAKRWSPSDVVDDYEFVNDVAQHEDDAAPCNMDSESLNNSEMNEIFALESTTISCPRLSPSRPTLMEVQLRSSYQLNNSQDISHARILESSHTSERQSGHQSNDASSAPLTMSSDAAHPVRSTRTKWFHQLNDHLNSNPSEAFTLLLLIRFAPYPFNLTNAVLGQCQAIKLLPFTIVTAMSLVKTLLYLWIGSNALEVGQLVSGHKQAGIIQIVEIASVALLWCIALVGGWFLYRTVQKITANSA